MNDPQSLSQFLAAFAAWQDDGTSTDLFDQMMVAWRHLKITEGPRPGTARLNWQGPLSLVREIGFDTTIGPPGALPLERIFFLGPEMVEGRLAGWSATEEAVGEFIGFWENQIQVAKDYIANGCTNRTDLWGKPAASQPAAFKCVGVAEEVFWKQAFCAAMSGILASAEVRSEDNSPSGIAKLAHDLADEAVRSSRKVMDAADPTPGLERIFSCRGCTHYTLMDVCDRGHFVATADAACQSYDKKTDPVGKVDP